MTGKNVNKNLSESKNQIFWLFGFIPFIRIKHIIKVKPLQKGHSVLLIKKYWLLCFVPLFSTEREWEE